MTHAWQNVSGGVCEMGDGYRSDVSGETEYEGKISVVRIRGHGGVTADAPPESERRGTGYQGGVTTPPPGKAWTYRVSFPKTLS